MRSQGCCEIALRDCAVLLRCEILLKIALRERLLLLCCRSSSVRLRHPQAARFGAQQYDRDTWQLGFYSRWYIAVSFRAV